MVAVNSRAARACCFWKWILLPAVTAFLVACASSKPVHMPPQRQTLPPQAAPLETVGRQEPSPELERPIVAPPAPIKEQDLFESQPRTAPPTTSADSAAEPPGRAAAPQYLASMHLVDQAKASLAAGDADSAILSLEQAIQVDVYNGQAFFELARAWRMQSSPQKALEFANKAELLLQDNRADLKRVYQFKAELYQELGAPAEAEYFLRQASRL